MSIHISQVFEFLEQYPVCKHEGDIPSLLEMIREVYTSYYPVENEEIQKQLQQFHWILNKVSCEDRDNLFQKVNNLCLEYEKMSFYHGMVVGMSLMTEINYLP